MGRGVRGEGAGWRLLIALAALALLGLAGLLARVVWSWDTQGFWNPVRVEDDFRSEVAALGWGLGLLWVALAIWIVAHCWRAPTRLSLLALLAPAVFVAAAVVALNLLEAHTEPVTQPWAAAPAVERGVTGCAAPDATPGVAGATPVPARSGDVGLTSVGDHTALGLCAAWFTDGDPALGLPPIGPYTRYLVLEVTVERRAGAPVAVGPFRFEAVNASAIGRGERATAVPVAAPAGLPDGTLKAGELVHGWVAFRLPDYADVIDVTCRLPSGATVRWTIAAPSGGR